MGMRGELIRRKCRRWAMRAFREGMSVIGRGLPMRAKIALGRRSTKLGYLLYYDGDFVIPDYLDRFRVNINARYTTERVILAGRDEADLTWAIDHLISPGDVCLDIGANIGAITLQLAKAAGPSGRVIAFEPGPPFFSRLKANLALNPEIASRVELHNLGLSDRPGSLHWVEDPEFPGNAILVEGRGLKVGVVTLDDFLGPRLDRLDFLKIDVEGMELEVLRGAVRLLERFRPKVFFESAMDFETYRGAPIRRETESLLTGLGYRLNRVARSALVPVAYPDFAWNTVALFPDSRIPSMMSE
jgi:FkbM family methyltransferase